MPFLSSVLTQLSRPSELPYIIQWRLRRPLHEFEISSQSHELQECFRYLTLTSRSFAAVIKELHPELQVPVCLFYLILRGLDTIEDDMTIDPKIKTPILLSFWQIISQPGWTFDGNAAREKDRDLLVHFDVVITEFAKIKPQYRDIIVRITKLMGEGMNEYLNNAEHNLKGVDTIVDYRKYCHHVAGLVGEGLTQLFVAAGFARPSLLNNAYLHESMGQFLQQINIIRDVHEDYLDGRRFWPREVWSKYVDEFGDLFDPARRETALNCSSEMVLLALSNINDCLRYMTDVTDQSTFNFVTIPQLMAIATLALVFRNPAIFERNVKITKGTACRLILDSSKDCLTAFESFRRCLWELRAKNDPKDANFVKISTACADIERTMDSIFASARSSTAASQQATCQLSKRISTLTDFVAVIGGLSLLILGVAWLAGAPLDNILASVQQNTGKALASSPGASFPTPIPEL